MHCCCPPIFLLCFWQMAIYFGQSLSKRKTRSPASSDESTLLPETKKAEPHSSPTHHEDEIMTALSMTQDVGAALQAILANIKANLENLEKRTQRLEDFQTTAKKVIDDLKKGINFTGWTKTKGQKTEAVEKAHRRYETQLAEMTTKCQKNENEIHTKNLYLKACS